MSVLVPSMQAMDLCEGRMEAGWKVKVLDIPHAGRAGSMNHRAEWPNHLGDGGELRRSSIGGVCVLWDGCSQRWDAFNRGDAFVHERHVPGGKVAGGNKHFADALATVPNEDPQRDEILGVDAAVSFVAARVGHPLCPER